LSDTPEPINRPLGLATDLVEYFVVVLADRASLGSVVPALTDLVRLEQIRVLDLIVLARDPGGGLDVLEVGDVDALLALRDLEGDLGLLSENDLQLASRVVRPGEVGLVLVVEDRWAEGLATAARRVSGHIIAGERISPRRVEAAFDDLTDDDPRG
jgi:Family of unknown function (DUF6325)